MMSESTRHARRLILLRGDRAATRARAARLTRALVEDRVLWAGGAHATRREVRQLLGRSFDAVVVELHDGLDADLVGQCHGFVVGGGALIVCAPLEPPRQPGLAAWGFEVDDVGHHLWDRVMGTFEQFDSGDAPIEPPTFVPRGTADQQRVVGAIVDAARGDGPIVVLTADRGRGKSAALGMSLGRVEGHVIVTASGLDAVREVFEFAPDAAHVRFAEPAELLRRRPAIDLLVVDEAAQLPVALLEELVAAYRAETIVFSTTTHGYEGTGRGFLLRFVEGQRAGARTLIELEMHTPIRWAANDPVERAVFEALLLNAEPVSPAGTDVTHRRIEQDELATDDRLLEEVFGLLVQAHYRTTPGDLHRLLDAPNLDVHASFAGGHVVAATLVAREGGLDERTAHAVHDGTIRVVGHALPDTFAAHLGYADAARLRMARSVRIATHTDRRRRGVAGALVDHVHDSYDVELFGTVFGATAELIAFRRSLGYEVVRISASRGVRTGVPSVVMVRAVGPEARVLVKQLRADLARELPTQLELLAAEGAVALDPALDRALRDGLPAPVALSGPRRDEIARHYAFGPRTFESAAAALREFVGSTPLDALPEDLRIVVERRVIAGSSWADTAATANMSVPAAMRGLRRALRTLIDTRASK